jgi:hypothetical protein
LADRNLKNLEGSQTIPAEHQREAPNKSNPWFKRGTTEAVMDDVQAEEIARVERELTALHSTHALLQRGARRVKLFCQVVIVPVVTATLVYLLVKDFVAGLFAIVICGAIGSVVWWLHPADARWIDFAVPQYWFMPGSYARDVEAWIAERERRLVQLKKDDPVDRNPAPA